MAKDSDVCWRAVEGAMRKGPEWYGQMQEVVLIVSNGFGPIHRHFQRVHQSHAGYAEGRPESAVLASSSSHRGLRK